MVHKEDYISGGVPLVNPSHMIRGRIVADADISVTIKKASELRAYTLSEGDMLLARRGEVGRYAVVAQEQHGWLCGTGSFFVRLSKEVSRPYLELVFSDPSFRSYLQGESIGTTMTNLNQRILLTSVLAIPPLAEQHRIVARVEQLRRLCADLRERLQQARATQSRLADALVSAAAQSPTC
jgi:type I restriction enzyme S subunit